MKIYKIGTRVLYLLMLIASLLGIANALYGAFLIDGTKQVSIFEAIGMVFAIVDTDMYETVSGIYNCLAQAMIGVFYLCFLIYMIKKIFFLLSLRKEIFDAARDDEGRSASFSKVLKTHIGIHFSVLVFVFVGRLTLDCEATAYTVALFILAVVLLIAAAFVNTYFTVSALPARISYSIFNAVRLLLMVACVFYALHALTSPLFRDIIYDLGLLSIMVEMGADRYVIYAIYIYLIEPIVLLIGTTMILRTFNCIVKNWDNSEDEYSNTAWALRSRLIFVIVIAICRIVITVYCGLGNIELSWSEMLLNRIFSLVRNDLLPCMIMIAGAMIVNYGMPALQYTPQKKARQICY